MVHLRQVNHYNTYRNNRVLIKFFKTEVIQVTFFVPHANDPTFTVKAKRTMAPEMHDLIVARLLLLSPPFLAKQVKLAS